MTPKERLRLLRPFFYILKDEIIKVSQQQRVKIILQLDTLAEAYGFKIDWKHGPGVEEIIKTHVSDPEALVRCMDRVELLRLIDKQEDELWRALNG